MSSIVWWSRGSITDSGKAYFEELMDTIVEQDVPLTFNFNVAITNLTRWMAPCPNLVQQSLPRSLSFYETVLLAPANQVHGIKGKCTVSSQVTRNGKVGRCARWMNMGNGSIRPRKLAHHKTSSRNFLMYLSLYLKARWHQQNNKIIL